MQHKDFEMTEAQFDVLKESFKPVPYMVIGGVEPSSPQENANSAWRMLGAEMGFIWDTVKPNGKGDRFFSAVPK